MLLNIEVAFIGDVSLHEIITHTTVAETKLYRIHWEMFNGNWKEMSVVRLSYAPH